MEYSQGLHINGESTRRVTTYYIVPSWITACAAKSGRPMSSYVHVEIDCVISRTVPVFQSAAAPAILGTETCCVGSMHVTMAAAEHLLSTFSPRNSARSKFLRSAYAPNCCAADERSGSHRDRADAEDCSAGFLPGMCRTPISFYF